MSHRERKGGAVDATTDSRAFRLKNRVHLDIMPGDRTQDEEIARLIRLGAAIVSDGRPDVGWVIMADPEGNEFCVEKSRAELAAGPAAGQ